MPLMMAYPDGSRGVTSPMGEFQYQLSATERPLTSNAKMETRNPQLRFLPSFSRLTFPLFVMLDDLSIQTSAR
jgi:hypothetical protein